MCISDGLVVGHECQAVRQRKSEQDHVRTNWEGQAELGEARGAAGKVGTWALWVETYEAEATATEQKERSRPSWGLDGGVALHEYKLQAHWDRGTSLSVIKYVKEHKDFQKLLLEFDVQVGFLMVRVFHDTDASLRAINMHCELLSDDKSATPGAESLEDQEELVVNHAGEYFSNYDEWTGYSSDGCDSNGVPHGAHGSVPGQLWSPNNVPSTDLDDDIDEELREELETDEFNTEIEREPELERENANEPPMEEPVVDDSGQHQHFADAATPPIDTCESHTERHLRVRPHVVSYPDNAGQPVCPVSEKAALTDQERYLNSLGDQMNPYAPFKSRMDWEIALWAKMRGSSSSAFTDLMGIDGV
ncbi:hypothetical protein EDB89DRAFT_1910010 [Lactarius sanguifluus]|nr:hypothetical protein EDB89DRAFT_1910010 [Lactarius sanguifluus]